MTLSFVIGFLGAIVRVFSSKHRPKCVEFSKPQEPQVDETSDSITQGVEAARRLMDLMSCSKPVEVVELRDVENCACECELIIRDLASLKPHSSDKRCVETLSKTLSMLVAQATELSKLAWKPTTKA